MLKKVYGLLALLLVAALAFSACAAPAPAPAGDDGGEMAESDDEAMEDAMDDGSMAMDWEGVDPSGQTVSFWYQHSSDREEALQKIITDFNTSNEWGITVNGEYQGGYGDIFNKMLGVAGTDDGPNLVVAYQNQAASYQLADALVDMKSLVASEKWGISEEEMSDYFEGFVNSDIFPTFDGARLGFPPNRSMEVLYYNADWLTELGFEGPPATPEEFKAAACAAVETPFSGATGDIDAIGYQLSIDASRLASWAFAFGGDVFDYESGEYSYDNDGAVAAMSFLQELFNEGCAAVVAEAYGDQTDFGNGNLLFTVGSSSGLPFYDSAVSDGAGFAWSIAPLPHTTPDPVMNIYGASVSIGKSTPEKELATWLFIKYYTSPEVQAEWARASNYFPVRESVADGLGEYFEENPAYQTAFELLKYGTAEPPAPGYDFVRDEAEATMAAIADGDDVASSLAELTATANEILADQLAE